MLLFKNPIPDQELISRFQKRGLIGGVDCAKIIYEIVESWSCGVVWFLSREILIMNTRFSLHCVTFRDVCSTKPLKKN